MKPPVVPPFQGNIDFNAQHSPHGAYVSFTCGSVGKRGGLVAERGHPAGQNLYLGVKPGPRTSDAPLRCLPFFAGAGHDDAAKYLVEQAAKDPSEPDAQPTWRAYAADQLQRHYGWGTDRWVSPDFEFAIYSPVPDLPDPSTAPPEKLRAALLPAVIAELAIDNTSGSKTKTGFLVMNFNQAGVRLLNEEVGPGRVGFALRRHVGVLAELEAADSASDSRPFLVCRWTVGAALRQTTPHLLGTCPGIGFEVPPGTRRRLRLALGVYLDGLVTTRLDGRYLYTRYYSDLSDVLGAALDRWDELTAAAQASDEELQASSLSADQKFLIAHATRSYCGSSQLLEIEGQPFWIVNEGEYCMMNTLDLSVDQVFWELEKNPWVVHNLLASFARHYSYRDQCGISFCHDMGVNNNFSPFSHSSYELPGLTGCFSYMTQEELCNWILIAACYMAKTRDRKWASENRELVEACLESMLERSRAKEARNLPGVMQQDSSRCEGGQEITTYDSLDSSLGQARSNLYLAVKCWASYLGLELMLGGSQRAFEQATSLAETIASQLLDDGFIPAVFEPDSPGYASRILPAAEGLVYPLYWASQLSEPSTDCDPGSWIRRDGPFAELIGALRTHTLTLLNDPQSRNVFADGGLKLSSSSDNSWFSKIALFQQVAREVLALEEEPGIRELLARADAAHVRWQTDGSGYWACSDQFVRGQAEGSRYYPRGVTATLWLASNRPCRDPSE